MSLEPRDDGGDDYEQQPSQGEMVQRRVSDMYKQNYSKAVLRRRLMEAEHKDGLGLELNAQDEFLIQNKQFFKKILRQGV
jgi:hypothetical protein